MSERRIETGASDTVVPPENSAVSIKIARAEIESANMGRTVIL